MDDTPGERQKERENAYYVFVAPLIVVLSSAVMGALNFGFWLGGPRRSRAVACPCDWVSAMARAPLRTAIQPVARLTGVAAAKCVIGVLGFDE